jgi:hypothetical protein
MRVRAVSFAMFGWFAAATAASAQGTPATTDLYHVHFTKSAPGQATAHAKALMAPDTTSPMPDHFIVLRHEEGDDWDYMVIQHLGPKAAVSAGGSPQGSSLQGLFAWHNDTFVSGPSWGEFTKELGIGGMPGQVYVVGVHRAVPGHRDQLLKSLSAAGTPGKIPTGNVLLQHVEGSDWTFATITRYNSWQDFGNDQAAAASSGDTAGGWADIRQHSAFHRDTIAGRIHPSK